MTGRIERRTLWALLLAANASWSAYGAEPAADWNALIEQIATGSADDAREASEQMIAELAAPLERALAAAASRPLPERQRIEQSLARVVAALRARMLRASLPPADQALVDQTLAGDPRLVEDLFADDPALRAAALHQLPLLPDTGAGVLIAAKIGDPDSSVREIALELAAELKDAAVARGVERYLADLLGLLRSAEVKARPEYVVALGDYAREAIELLGRTQNRDALPVVLEAIQLLGRAPYRQRFGLAPLLAALGSFEDERAVALLLDHLSDAEVHAVRSIGSGKMVQLTAGDVALLSLARIYRIPPATLGFYIAEPQKELLGFADESARHAALRAFTQWHEQNAARPPAERSALTTQPAAAEPDVP